MIKKRVGRLAYKLDLPDNIKIHPVVSLSQLEPALTSLNNFGRQLCSKPPPIDGKDSYKIKSLLSRRINPITKKTQYLVKWAQYPTSDNAWYNIEDLTHARDLIKECDQHIREGELTPKDRQRP